MEKGFVDASVPLTLPHQVKLVVAARAALYAANVGWSAAIGEALDAAGLPRLSWQDAVEVLGSADPWTWHDGPSGDLEYGTEVAWWKAREIVSRVQGWAEAQSPPLCSLVEQIMCKIGLAPVVASAPRRPSLAR